MSKNVYLIREEVEILQEDCVVVLEKGDRIIVNEQFDQRAPWALPRIGLRKWDLFIVSNEYRDNAGDYRVEITNNRTKESMWLIFDSREEAIRDGWVEE